MLVLVSDIIWQCLAMTSRLFDVSLQVAEDGTPVTRVLSVDDYTQLNDGEWQCNVCSTICSSQDDVIEHVTTAHLAGTTTHQCPLCAMTFTRKALLKQHVRGMHNVSTIFKCVFCEAVFERRDELQQHERRCDVTAKQQRCRHCRRLFRQKYAMKLHERHCSKGKQQQRESPGGRGGDVSRAAAAAESKRFKCLYCDSAFSYEKSLKSHEDKFHQIDREAAKQMGVLP